MGDHDLLGHRFMDGAHEEATKEVESEDENEDTELKTDIFALDLKTEDDGTWVCRIGADFVGDPYIKLTDVNDEDGEGSAHLYFMDEHADRLPKMLRQAADLIEIARGG